MFWKFGWILDSLNYRTERELRKTIFLNENFKKQRWSWLENTIIWGSKHLLLTNFFLIIFWFAATFFIVILYATFKSHFPVSTNGHDIPINFSEAIFNAQVTIIALIFPLVIAFIGILIQSRSANEVIWVVYKHNSGFMLVGFSALLLVLTFVLTKFVQPWLSYQYIIALYISLALWFIFNLLLSGWFLYKTINFITTSTRMKLLVRFAVNDFLIADIRKRLFFHLAHSVIKDEFNVNKRSNLNIVTMSYTSYANRVNKFFEEPMQISNIWFRPLKLGVLALTNRYKHELAHSNSATLYFPIDFNVPKSGEISIAETNIGRFDDISSSILRLPFRFSSKDHQYLLTFEQVVGAIFGQVEDALKENNSLLFSNAKNELQNFQKEIESCSFYIDENDEARSWMLLPDNKFFSRNYLHLFINETIRISNSVVSRIPEDQSYYSEWCYFFTGLYARSDKNRPSEVGINYIKGHYFLWGKLMSWISGYNKINSRFDQMQDSAIKHFVGSWEHWHYLLNGKHGEQDSIDFELLFHHLMSNSKMIVSATKYNNIKASEWAVDMLIYWSECFIREDAHEFYWHKELLTSAVIDQQTNSILLDAAFGQHPPSNMSEVKSIILRNYWIDIRFLTASYIIGSSNNTGSSQIDRHFIARKIINAERMDNSGSLLRTEAPLNTPAEILGIFLRQNLPWNDSFTNELYEKHIDQLGSIEEPDWISGRMYSSRGSKHELYVPKFFLIVSIAFTTNTFMLDTRWIDFLHSAAINQNQLETIIEKLKKLSNVDQNIINEVCAFSQIDETTAKSKADVFIASINEIIGILSSHAKQNIINSEVDYSRLKLMGITASIDVFDNNAPMPVALFKQIHFLENAEFQPSIINVNGFEKAQLVNRIDSEPPVDTFFNSTISELVAQKIIDQIINSFNWTDKAFENELALLTEAVADAALFFKAGLSPILFVGQQSLITLINYSRFGYIPDNEKLPFDIIIATDQPETYIAHLQGVEVHSLPTRQRKVNFMIATDSFKNLNVKKFEDERYVDFDFILPTPESLKGTLKVRFAIDCDFDPTFGNRYSLDKIK